MVKCATLAPHQVEGTLLRHSVMRDTNLSPYVQRRVCQIDGSWSGSIVPCVQQGNSSVIDVLFCIKLLPPRCSAIYWSSCSSVVLL